MTTVSNDAIEIKNSIIDQMRQAVSKRDSFLFNLSDRTNDFRITLPAIINLNSNLDYEIALIRFEAFNSFYNVTTLNNNFRYYNGTIWKTITLSPGSYEISAINDEIQRLMVINNDVTVNAGVTTYNFKLYANFSTLKSVIDLTSNFQVDFTDTGSPNNLRNLLGYDSAIITTGLYKVSQNIVNIQTFNSLFINCDLCTNSYLNNMTTQALRSFSSNSVPTGYKISIEPSNPIWLPIQKSKYFFNDYHVWITNENGNLVSFNGENVSITIWLRSV